MEVTRALEAAGRAQQTGFSTRQEQALRKKWHWQEAQGSQQAGAGDLQLARVATQGVGGGGRGRATVFMEEFLCGEKPGLTALAGHAHPTGLASAWELLAPRRPQTRHPHPLPHGPLDFMPSGDPTGTCLPQSSTPCLQIH